MITPRIDKPAATEPNLNAPEALARATAELRALGIDDEVVFTARTPAELLAYLHEREPACAPST